MPGFDPLTLSAAYILASLSTRCPAQVPVDIDIRFIKNDNPVIVSLTSAQLQQRFRANQNSTFATDGSWTMYGATVVNPGTNLKDSFGFGVRMELTSGAACFAVSKVQYTITYSPQIYIASDLPDTSCRYRSVRAHEQRHVDTDVKIINDYVPEMRRKIQDEIDAMGVQGPYPPGDVEAEKRRVGDRLASALRGEWDELLDLRRKKQAEFDTIQNYMIDTAACPAEFPQIEGAH